MVIVTYRKVFFAITAVIIALSLGAIFGFGLNLSTDFTGGTLVEMHYTDARPSAQEVSDALSEAQFTGFSVREAGDKSLIIRAGSISPEMRAGISDTLTLHGGYQGEVERLTEVGPVIGTELRNKAFIAVAVVLLAIMLYVAFAFRKVSKPVSSWVYGSIALIALVHDVIVPTGFFAVLGHYFGAQVDTLFVTAILTILGFSVHDTIVVFDRIRENLRINAESNKREDFAVTAGRALSQTFVRSVNTSLTVLISLGVLFYIGPVATQDFSLTLIVGIVAGTFSSIALATPLLVAAEKWRSTAR